MTADVADCSKYDSLVIPLAELTASVARYLVRKHAKLVKDIIHLRFGPGALQGPNASVAESFFILIVGLFLAVAGCIE